jgi:hypothetical protein
MFELSTPRDGDDAEVVMGDEIISKVRMSPTYLPRRSGEFPFAPAQYCYAASKTGVVPSWRFQ